jgi:hypothetical protein
LDERRSGAWKKGGAEGGASEWAYLAVSDEVKEIVSELDLFLHIHQGDVVLEQLQQILA